MEASPNTVAGYRDTFRLLLRFASQRVGRPPTGLAVADLDATLVGEFLAHVESSRGNAARTRNTRLAAVRSFFRFVAMEEPAHLLHCQRVLAMPGKRYVRRAVDFLDPAEADALAAAPDRSTWVGRRDHALLLVATQTGLRASELTGLRRCDLVAAGAGAHLRCEGKGRKQRCTPLRRGHARDPPGLAQGVRRRRPGPALPDAAGVPDEPRRVGARRPPARPGRRAVVPVAADKRVSPHVLRHTAAMQLLHHGVDQTVIALWLGHESVGTTQVYVHADLRLKERALARVTTETTSKPGRYRPDDELLAFLEGL